MEQRMPSDDVSLKVETHQTNLSEIDKRREVLKKLKNANTSE